MSSDDVAEDHEVPRKAPAPRRGRSAPTIYDIAKSAGVNPSTVSRALNQPGRINIKTEERIRAAAKELNYRLNPMARALPTGRTNTLGLLLADITNPMIFGIVRGAEHAAAAQGYTLVIAESQESGEREATTAERIQPAVDGLILGTSRLSDAHIQRLAEFKPLVLINREVDGVPSILPDLAPGIDQAIEHLAALGHTRIAYLAGPTTSWMSSARWNSLRSRALTKGMSIIEIGPGAPTLEGGRAAIEEIMASGVTAVIAYNDLMAIGVLQAAAEHGVPVPAGLSVIGFDDIFGADFTTPALTTVRMPLDLEGERAVRRTLDILGVEPTVASTDDAVIVTSLVVRGSTGPADS